MIKNIIIGLILSFGISTKATACLAASQERIIPIGTSENCLIGIEIISNRYGEGEFGEKTFWNYKITLKGYNSDYSDYVIAELDSNAKIEDNKTEHFLVKQFEKALKICDSLNDFEILIPKEIKFCDFQKKCTEIELIYTEKELTFKTTNNNKKISIHFLSSEYKGKIANPYKDYFRNYFQVSDIMGIDLKVSSIRSYENSKYKLLVFHLGTGQEFKDAITNKYPEKKEYEFDKELNNSIDAVFIEPILHHGKGFDYFVMNEIK
jgi:hypothetical protein